MRLVLQLHLVPLAAHLIAEQECQQSNWEKRDRQHQGVSDEKRPRSGQNCSVFGKEILRDFDGVDLIVQDDAQKGTVDFQPVTAAFRLFARSSD